MGQAAEQRAVNFLKQKQYQILDVNIRVANSEVDIVAYDPNFDEIVFVEVKARSTDNFGHPSSAVNWRKVQSMTKVAVSYLRAKRLAKDFRFDIITVTPSGVDHFENITWL